MKIILLYAIGIIFNISAIYCQSEPILPVNLKFTILYDDIALNDPFIGDQGFSCLIELNGKSLLFDAGNTESILKNNTEMLKIDCSKIETIFISHLHTDHICGLTGIIEKFNRPALYLPADFPRTQTPRAKGYVQKTLSDAVNIGAKAVFITKPGEISEHVFTTGTMEEKTYEQALVINTAKGLVILVGCSHPGIVEIVKQAKAQLNKDVYFVMGGFHLEGSKYPDRIKEIADELKGLTMYIAAGHCNDEKAQDIFRSVFGNNFIEMKAGLPLRLSDLANK